MKSREIAFDRYLIVQNTGELELGMQTVFVFSEAYQRYIYAYFADEFGFFKVYIMSVKMMLDIDTFIRKLSKEQQERSEIFKS